VIELIHPELSNVSKSDIKSKLAQTLKSKEENISIFGLKTKFGGGRSTGFALIYDSLDARKKFDSKKMLRRVSCPTHIKSAFLQRKATLNH
jgi:ribosomal protein S24E